MIMMYTSVCLSFTICPWNLFLFICSVIKMKYTIKKLRHFQRKDVFNFYIVRQTFLLAYNIQHTIYNKEEEKKIFVF
jgi:hypothetical protein